MSDQANHNHEEESADWQPQIVATVICLVALLLAMTAEHLWLPLASVFYLISFAAGMRYPLVEAAEEIAEGTFDVDFLMLLVALGAWALGHPAEGATLLVLFGASRSMEAYARRRTRSAIEALTTEMPDTAHRVGSDDDVEEIPLDQIKAGDLLQVRPGEKFPVDCILAQGKTTIDMSAITGESEPLTPEPGAEIPSGALNGGGLVRVQVIHLARESAYQKIIQLVESAPSHRSQAQVLSDRVGRYFTAAILFASIAGFLIWWLALGLPFKVAGYRAMVLLVAGSPCALVLSIPSAVLAGIAAGARRGILFHGGRGLLAAAGVRTVALDKTGTLTTGEPSVSSVTPYSEDRDHQLSLARRLAGSSTHPAAGAVLRHISEDSDECRHDLSDIAEVAGEGVHALHDGGKVMLGRCPVKHRDGEECAAAQNARVVLSADGQPRMCFHLSETLREQAAETVAALKQRGVRVLLLSGDLTNAVNRLAGQLGIEEAFGDLRPEQKWEAVAKAADGSSGGQVMMVGDGVNDAPALAAAEVGVAMGMRGSAATLAQADIVLVKDRLPDLVEALDLGRAARRIVRQNLVVAIGAAAILVGFAIVGGLPLSLGVFGHEGGTVLVVLNSLRLLLRTEQKLPSGTHGAPQPIPQPA
ncbi:cadmium-translocating P-type ATPase [bacterium]|nr:cadmium-translocating P-type ATPase [bacterium]